MYRLKHASVVPVPGRPLRVGLPIYQHTEPNIAIVSSNNMDPVHLNAVVLRQALLNSPEEVEAFLGLKVIDIYAEPIKEAQPVPKEKPAKLEPQSKTKKETKPSKESKEADEEWV